MMSTKEAAEMLGVTPRRIQAMIKAGQLQAIKLGRDWFMNKADVEKLLDRPGRGRPKKDD